LIAGYDRDVSTNEVQLFWKPDVFFSNEKTGHLHTLVKPNTFVRIYPEGRLFISSRYENSPKGFKLQLVFLVDFVVR